MKNLINLNKNENIKNNDNFIYQINYLETRKSFHKRRLEKSPECLKFFLNEKKNYFNDDDKYKLNNTINHSKTIEPNIDENKIKKVKIISLKKDKGKDGITSYYNLIQLNQIKEGVELLDYDGDMEMLSYRHEYRSAPKNINKQNKENQNKRKWTDYIFYFKKNKDDVKDEQKDINKKEGKKISNEIIDQKNIKLITKDIYYDTFCLGFFVSGISAHLKENSINDNSFNFLSPCGHKYCSFLLSIKPEILHYFKNDNFEITNDLLNNISDLTFPLGIKICIEGTFESKNVIQLPQQIFFNVIENNGEKLYICTKYYFIKIKIKEFKKKYNFDIISYFSEKIEKNKNNLKKYIANITQLLKGDSFLIPQSITLLSKEPFLNCMEICLNGFLESLLEERASLINHIVNEIPSPYNGNQIKFYISPYFFPMILNHEMNMYKVMSLFNKEEQIKFYYNNYLSKEQLNFKVLFEMISIEHIIFIFQLILLEQKLLFIYNDYRILSEIIFILISLIYPFSWENNNIFPIISLDKINLLKSIKPFIAGMDEYLYSYIDKNINNNIFKFENEDIIIYNLSQKRFISCKNRKKIKRKDLLHEYKLFPLPEKITNYLLKELKVIIKYINSKENLFSQKKEDKYDFNFYKKFTLFKQNVEYNTKMAFMKSLLMLIGDYSNYSFYIEEQKPLFNIEAFIESHKDKEFKSFLNRLLNTQLFNNFLENEKKIFFIKKNLNNIENEILYNMNNDIYYDTSYFMKLSFKFPELINNQEKINKECYLSNIMNHDIYIKAKMICSKLTLINNKTNNSINNEEENNLKNEQSEKFPISKKKILFSGKNYLEDKPGGNNNIDKFNLKKNNNDKLYSMNYNNFYIPIQKEFRLSNKESTLRTNINLINKNDINDINKERQKLFYIDINSNKRKSSIVKDNDKNQIIKKYLLYPYFLNSKGDDEDYIKEIKTDQIIMKEIMLYKKRKNIKEKIPPFLTVITTISKDFDFNNYNIKKEKMYLIKNNYNTINVKNAHNSQNKTNKNHSKNSQNFNNEVILFKSKYFKEEKSEKDIIDLNIVYRKDDEIILINKFFKSCFINKPKINEEHYNLLKKLFLNLENIEYFANLIIPDNILNNKNNHKQLTISSFDKFSKIMKLSFENLSLNDNNLGILLTLACFIYYKIDKDSKIIYIYKNFIINNSDNSQKNSQPYKLWKTDSFWIEFFNYEFENNNKQKIEEEFLINNNNNNKNNINKVNINIINNNNEKEDLEERKKMNLIKTVIEISYFMFKLNIERNFIINIIEKIILPVFINDFYYINIIMNLALNNNGINK